MRSRALVSASAWLRRVRLLMPAAAFMVIG
jgi:hypothetical protein